MGISDKTRKLLWGKSGNKCAMCKRELSINPTEKDDNSIVGDECHIISRKEEGPRFDKNYPAAEIDSYKNLILLCKVHHKQVDDQSVAFTAEILIKMKKEHEKWVSEKLKSDGSIPQDHQAKKIKIIPPEYIRITTGKELSNVIVGAHYGYPLKYDEPASRYEAQAIEEFADFLEDLDILPELGLGDRVRIENQVTQVIENLEMAGFWVFGGREKRILETNGQQQNLIYAIVRIIRETSDEIVKLKLKEKK